MGAGSNEVAIPSLASIFPVLARTDHTGAAGGNVHRRLGFTSAHHVPGDASRFVLWVQINKNNGVHKSLQCRSLIRFPQSNEPNLSPHSSCFRKVQSFGDSGQPKGDASQQLAAAQRYWLQEIQTGSFELLRPRCQIYAKLAFDMKRYVNEFRFTWYHCNNYLILNPWKKMPLLESRVLSKYFCTQQGHDIAGSKSHNFRLFTQVLTQPPQGTVILKACDTYRSSCAPPECGIARHVLAVHRASTWKHELSSQLLYDYESWMNYYTV